MNHTNEVIALVQVRRLAKSGAARAIRLESDLSLSEVGAAIGASPSAVSRWESGERTPRGAAALAYAELLDRLPKGAGKDASVSV